MTARLLSWLKRDRPCAVGDIASRLDRLARLSRPPTIKMPALVRDDAGRVVAAVAPVTPRPSGAWDGNCDARKP